MNTEEDKIIQEMKKEIYWESTAFRMLQNDNYSAQDLNEIVSLWRLTDRDMFIDELLSPEHDWGIPKKTYIVKANGKKRVVYIYSIEKRFIMGVLCRVFSEIFKDEISDKCFSYKKGVVTATAIAHLAKDKRINEKYGYKMDIHAYFNSVTREHLQKCLDELFGDFDRLRVCMEKLFFNDDVYVDDDIIQEYKALIPGSALGAFFGNYCLRDLDFEIGDQLGYTYARYSDDIIVFTDTKVELDNVFNIINNKIKEYGLEINPSKNVLYNPGDRIEYLGLEFYVDKDGKKQIDLSKAGFEKIKGKIKVLEKNYARQARKKGVDSRKCAFKMVSKFNNRVYQTYVRDKSKFGWAYYIFRFITVDATLKQIDFYLKDRMRYVITGKNNKANFRITDADLCELGYYSMVQLWYLFKTDIDLYKSEVYKMNMGGF